MVVRVGKIAGFKEFLPEEQMVLEHFKGVIAKHYKLFGFVPIEVAAVERKDVLLSKSGENTKQIYGIHLIERSDQQHGSSEKDLALHFDLTVPLARYVAMNYGHLVFPFRRYQIQKVWRGERPQENKGRFREFYQCDIDVIGDGELSLANDAEMPLVINNIFTELNIGKFVVRLNNRKITGGLFESLGLPEKYVGGTIDTPDDQSESGEAKARIVHDSKERFTFNLLDTLEKVGTELVETALCEFLSIEQSLAQRLIEFVMHQEESPHAMLHWLQSQQNMSDQFVQGVNELAKVMRHMSVFGMPVENYVIDLGVTRGLDYYTGTVYETTLVNYPSIGSICSGGRFDDLASTFIERKLPGVGISIGLTRLCFKLMDAGIIEVDSQPKSTSKVIILRMDAALEAEYARIAAELRCSGIACEVFLEDRRVDKQTKFAGKKRIPYVVFLDQKRLERGVCTVRHIDGDEQEVALEKLVGHLH